MRSSNQSYEIEMLDASRISWNSILAGVLAVITGSITFNLLGMSIGLGLFHPSRGIIPTFTVGAICWLIISAILSMYAGGLISSFLSGQKRVFDGALSGLMTGSLSLLIFFIATVSLSGTILSTTFTALNSTLNMTSAGINNVGFALSNAAKGINKVVPDLGENVKKTLPDLDPIITKINKKAEELLPPDGSSTEEKTKKIKGQLTEFLNRYLDAIGKDEENIDEVSKDFSKFLVEITGKTQEEINKDLDEWKQTYLEAKEKAHQTIVHTSEKAAKALSQLAVINFFIIVISLLTSVAGGINGIKCRERV